MEKKKEPVIIVDATAINDLSIKADQGGNVTDISFSVNANDLNKKFSLRNEIIEELNILIANKDTQPEVLPYINEAKDFIVNHITEISWDIFEDKIGLGWEAHGDEHDLDPNTFMEYFKRDFMNISLSNALWRDPKYRTIHGMEVGKIGLYVNKKLKSKKKPRISRKGRTKVRVGAYLIDNIIKNNKPDAKQLSIFDTMLQETKDRIISSGTSIDLINRRGEGIKLTKGEYRVLLSLSNILHEKSQTLDPKASDYYTGNEGSSLILFNTDQGEVSLKSPKVSFSLYEITKEFHGGENVGGEQVRHVGKLLYDIAEDPTKKALIRYTRRVDKGKGVTREYFLETYDSLIKIITAGYKDMIEGNMINEKKEIIVSLHPIFIDQISSKYIDLPIDLTRRMIEANGSSNISEITTKLVLELARGYSGKRNLTKDAYGNPIYCIGKENLFYKIAESYLPPNRKRIPLIEEYFTKAIETAKAIGLLLSYEEKPGVTGDEIYYFTLSKDWQ